MSESAVMEAPAPSTKDAKSGKDVLALLKSTGTGAERCQMVEAFLADNPRATGAEVVEWLITQGAQIGTIRKAGKFVHGAAFEPNQGGTAGTEEVIHLREQVEDLLKTIREHESQRAKLLAENAALREQVSQLTAVKGSDRIKGSEKNR